jgi:hypothetical protein
LRKEVRLWAKSVGSRRQRRRKRRLKGLGGEAEDKIKRE